MRYFKIFFTDGGYDIIQGESMRQTMSGGLEILGKWSELEPIALYNPRIYSYVKEIQWQDEAKSLMKISKVQAIKFCREVTGLGLKEAKEACEAL